MTSIQPYERMLAWCDPVNSEVGDHPGVRYLIHRGDGEGVKDPSFLSGLCLPVCPSGHGNRARVCAQLQMDLLDDESSADLRK